MRWQIEHWVFCDLQQTLTSDEKIVQLEPMVVELLSYFCHNSGRIISRDELVEKVWLGRTITDNAVNRVVTKLRKALQDNPKQPKFIATFPKKGYKFIAEPLALKQGLENSIESNSASSSAQLKVDQNTGALVAKTNGYSKRQLSTKTLSIMMVVLVFVLGSLGIIISQLKQSNVHPTISHIKALTRGADRESQPRISPDGHYLAYVEFNGEKMRTKIKSLADSTEIELSHGEQLDTWVGSLSWRADGKQIVYLVTTSNTCQYYIRDFQALVLSAPKLIYNCPAGSYGKIAFTHNHDRVIFSESEGRNKPFSLFELNLANGDKRRLNQPEIFIGGNSQFDLHPSENKLLISSPDKQQWEGFYSLDLESDELILLFKQDAYICCGIWDHSGERVVLMGEHPAYQLVSYDLSGNDRQVIYSGGQQIGPPQRHSNGKDYLLTAGGTNMNVLYYQRDHKQRSGQTRVNLIADSSVDDRLARFDYQSKYIAYISLASGSEEIWLTDLTGSQPRKLTHFDDDRHYIDLLWSYNGSFLVALALNEIHIIHSQTGDTYKLDLPQFEIRGVSLKDDTTISFSSKVNNQWRVTHYDLTSNQLSYLDTRWRYVHYAIEPEDSWWMDQQGQFYIGSAKERVSTSAFGQLDALAGRVFNLRKLANHWYWQSRDSAGYQLFTRAVDARPDMLSQLLLQNHSHSFDLSKHGILYHQADQVNRDIFTTVSTRN